MHKIPIVFQVRYGIDWEILLYREQSLSIEGAEETAVSNSNGSFSLRTFLLEEVILEITAPYFTLKRLPVVLEGKDVDLGPIILSNDITLEKTDNLITLTESDLSR